MDVFSRSDLQTLIDGATPPCVSLYMPMHRTMPDAQQNPIRFRNLIQEAEKRLVADGGKANGMLAEAKNLLNETEFWRHPADGLAAFIAPGQFQSYRLPITFGEMLVITGRFHTKPLLPLFTGDGRFYILALSQNDVRVFECTRHNFKELELPDMPRNRREALNETVEKQRQLHSFGSSATGERVGIFHGHGSSTDETKDFQFRYCREIDRALTPKIKHDTAPLVLAAVDYLHPLYRDVNTYPHLLADGVIGNPELWNAEDLHRLAWTVVEPHFMKARDEAMTRYAELKNTSRAANDIKTIVPAAFYGRVDTLFVTVGMQQWGKFDADTGAIDVHDAAQRDDVDLLDAAATQTLLNQGVVYAVNAGQVPDFGLAAAILRY